MTAYTVIACDGCAQTITERSNWSASIVRKFVARKLGWRNARSAPITYKVSAGTEHERDASFTLALDYCASCVRAGYHKNKRPLSIKALLQFGKELQR